MASPASIGKHPIHPMLVAFPIGLFVVAFLCDIGLLVTHDPTYGTVAFYTIAAGVVGALLAALPGFIDYLSLKDRKVKELGTWHMLINLSVVALFAINWYLRTKAGLALTGGSTMIPFALSLLGTVMLGVSGWLGGEMVYVHGVAVEPQRDTRIEEMPARNTDSRRVA
jgi:uncharacterized membrane protein